MFGKNEESNSEPQQIIILTLGMTAVGFLLLYIVLQVWMVPGLREQVKQQQGYYSKLVASFESSEMKQLRHEAKLQKENEEQKTLGEIIVETLPGYALSLAKDTDKRPPLRVSPGGSRDASGLQAVGRASTNVQEAHD